MSLVSLVEELRILGVFIVDFRKKMREEVGCYLGNWEFHELCEVNWAKCSPEAPI